jgi:Domain of unknown function (DUF4399)
LKLNGIEQRLFLAATAVCMSLALLAGCATPAPSQSVSILEPADGATVASTFKVRFGVKGMAVAPAGEIVPNSGHNHLLINRTSVPAGQSVPFDDQHKHFGAGQTETMITLPPGQYTLTSQFANGAHQSYGTPMSSSIRVTVK